MRYATFRPWFIESDYYFSRVSKELVIIDGGCRGKLFDPFCFLEEGIEVVAFDPDAMGEQESSTGIKTTFINKALWSQSGNLSVHIAKNPATSSVYPPNLELLATFCDTVGEPPRRTEKIIEVPCISIDDAVDQGLCSQPDFIKLDVHSSEYEALTGAKRSLRGVVGVLVESWHTPIHLEQHLHGELEHFLNQHGFYIFRLIENSPWKHMAGDAAFPLENTRLVGTETLFFRDDWDSAILSDQTPLTAAAIADLFGYSDFSILLAKRFLSHGHIDRRTYEDLVKTLNELKAERLKRTRLRRTLKRIARGFIRYIRTP